MGIQLYRKGNSHIIRGVKCEMTVTDGDINTYLADGWVKNEQDLIEAPEEYGMRPEDFDKAPAIIKDKEPDNSAAEERAKAQKKREDAFDLELLRSNARHFGLKNVGNKSAATLEKELAELQEE